MKQKLTNKLNNKLQIKDQYKFKLVKVKLKERAFKVVATVTR